MGNKSENDNNKNTQSSEWSETQRAHLKAHKATIVPCLWGLLPGHR